MVLYNRYVRPPFMEQLRGAWSTSGSFLCVGLDPDIEHVRKCVPNSDRPVFEFCREIIDLTADLVCAFKPQIAFFSSCGAEDDLKALISYVHAEYPEIPVLLDAKRGDVGSTAEQYAKEAFDRYNADAVTVNPYLGWESIEPYRRYGGRGIAVLCRTSNPGSEWLQEYPERDPTYLRVARAAAERDEGDLMLVTGATYPQQLKLVREVVGDMPLLVPGVGAQGGEPSVVIDSGVDSLGRGLLVNVSRSVIFASITPNFQDPVRAAAEELYAGLSIPDHK